MANITVIDYFKDWYFNHFDTDAEILSGSFDGINTTLVFSDSLHLRFDLTFFNLSQGYTVISTDPKTNTVVVGGDVLNLIGTFVKITPPFFFNGTPLLVESEIIPLPSNQKYPMLYFYEMVGGVKYAKGNNTGLRESWNVTLFFLDEAYKEGWDTTQHYDNVIVPLTKLVDRFVEYIQYPNCCISQEKEDIKVTNHINFGIFIKDKGHLKQIFTDKTSGIELNFRLNIRNC